VSQKRKVTLYFNSAMLAETQREAIRQDRSVSWIIQAAWRIARDEVRRIPTSGAALDHDHDQDQEPDALPPQPQIGLLLDDTRSEA
jgi:uncharacterized small protein (TIGR04563 family)